MKIRLLFLLAIVFGSCQEASPPEPADGLGKEKFIDVMIDVQLSEAMRTQRGVRERNEGVDAPELYQSVFEKHGITKEKFLISYNYYKAHPAEMELVYEAVLDSLSKLEVEIKQAYTASQSAKRDSLETAKRKNFEKMRGIDAPE